MRQAWQPVGKTAARTVAALYLAMGVAGCGGTARQCSTACREYRVYSDLARPTSVRVQPAERNPSEVSARRPTPNAPREPGVDSAPSAPPARRIAATKPPIRSVNTSRYVIQTGDRIEVLYTESWTVEGAYRLLPGDRVAIEYLHLVSLEEGGQGAGVGNVGVAGGSPLDRQLLIAPDGKLALPYLGTVDAAGLTVGELSDRLNARYQEFFVEPNILVTLMETGARLADLRAAIRTAGSRVVLVSPDGSINLPHVGFVSAAGLTLGELELELSERYRRATSGWAVTVRLAEQGPAEGDSEGAETSWTVPASELPSGSVAATAPEIPPVADMPSDDWVR